MSALLSSLHALRPHLSLGEPRLDLPPRHAVLAIRILLRRAALVMPIVHVKVAVQLPIVRRRRRVQVDVQLPAPRDHAQRRQLRRLAGAPLRVRRLRLACATSAGRQALRRDRAQRQLFQAQLRHQRASVSIQRQLSRAACAKTFASGCIVIKQRIVNAVSICA